MSAGTSGAVKSRAGNPGIRKRRPQAVAAPPSRGPDGAAAVAGDADGGAGAQQAVTWLAQLIPQCRAVLLQHDREADRVQVLADSQAPDGWKDRQAAFDPESMLARAVAETGRTAWSTTELALAQTLPWLPADERRQSLLACIAVPDPMGPARALVALVKSEFALSPEVDAALQLVSRYLAMLAADARADSNDAERQKAIEKAKREWERTADALSEMVCLLDRDGRILRANRAVENWMLGPVAEAIGKPVHELLHPECNAPECMLHHQLREGHRQLRSGKSQEFEYQEALSDRMLQFVLLPLHMEDDGGKLARDSYAVLVVSDFSALYQARAELERLNANLEVRVRERTRELAESNRDLRNEAVRRARAEEALRASGVELAALSEQLIKAQESERKKIALELHDSIGQSLSAIKYTIERALEMIRQPRLGSPEPVLQGAVKRIQEAAENIRSISMNLRPNILDNLGVASAVRWFCREFADIYPALAVHADVAVADGEIPERLTTVIFRCVEELMNNVAKHSQAKNVWLVLRRDAELISLEVRDDGIGILPKIPGPGRVRRAVLSSLRERAEMSGGELSHSSAQGSGYRAQMTWRLTSEEAMGAGIDAPRSDAGRTN